MDATREARPTTAERLLQAWARTAVAAFYRSVELEAPWGPPGEGPVVLAANHSNALGDVAVLVAKMPRFPHFLAAGTWWRHAPVRLLFRLGGVYPVHRARDGGGIGRNLSTFGACAAALARGEHLAIFPEGELNLDSQLLDIKTGAARIALAAADAEVRGVTVVPVGLLYEDRGRFRSSAVVRFGEPIRVDEHVDRYRLDAVGAVQELTAALRRRLELVTLPSDGPQAPAPMQRRTAMELAVLSPVAALGMVAGAPAVAVVSLVARLVPGEGWQATVKGVAGTVMLPLGWCAEAALLRRRFGGLRATGLVAAGAFSGKASLAWLDRLRHLRAGSQVGVAEPRASDSRRTISSDSPISDTSASESRSPVSSDSSMPAGVRR
jgi:1-acyl-sn-glycerol-3-phosphate acyltransferase